MYGTRMSLQCCNAEERWMQMKSELTAYQALHVPQKWAGYIIWVLSLTDSKCISDVAVVCDSEDNKSDLWPQSPGAQTGLLPHYWAIADSTNSYQTWYWSHAPRPPLDPEVGPVIQRYNYDFFNVLFLFCQVIASETMWIVFFQCDF